MSELVINPQSNEISCASANTVANAQFVRLFNTSGSSQVVTLKDASATQYANLTMTAASAILLYKAPLATVQGTSIVAMKLTSQSRTPQ